MQSTRSLTLDAQRFVLQMNFSDFRVVKSIRQKEVIWEGYLQPNPLLKKYRVKIAYNTKSRPHITLPDEVFPTRPPHTFEDGSLCLYHLRGIGAWRPSMSIALLVPMISHWLWCYEMWLTTGVWHGEEFPHPESERKLSV